jgi:hypothetical protein
MLGCTINIARGSMQVAHVVLVCSQYPACSYSLFSPRAGSILRLPHFGQASIRLAADMMQAEGSALTKTAQRYP